MQEARKKLLLEKLAVKRDTFEKQAIVDRLVRGAKSLGKQFLTQGKKKATVGERVFGQTIGVPARAIGRAIKNLAVGSSKPGRPWYAPNRAGVRQVTKEQAAELRKKGRNVWQAKGPTGGEITLTEKFRPGGIAGYAVKHPVITGGAALMGAPLLSGLNQQRKQRNLEKQYAEQQQAAQAPEQPQFINWG